MALHHLTYEEKQKRADLSEDEASILAYAENLFLILSIRLYEKYTGDTDDDTVFIEMQRTNKSITLTELRQFYHLLRKGGEKLFPAIVPSLPDSYNIRVVVDRDGGKFQDYGDGTPFWHEQMVSVTSPYMNCSISCGRNMNDDVSLRVMFPFVTYDKDNDEFKFPLYVGVDLKSERFESWSGGRNYPLPPLPKFIKDVHVRVADNLTVDNYIKGKLFPRRRGAGIASSKSNKVYPLAQPTVTNKNIQMLTPSVTRTGSLSTDDVLFDIQRSKSSSVMGTHIPGQPDRKSILSTSSHKSTEFNDLPLHIVEKIKDGMSDDVRKLYFSIAQGIDATQKSIKRLSSKHNAITSYAKNFSFILGHYAPCEIGGESVGHDIVMVKTDISLNLKEYRRLTDKIFTFTDWWYTWGNHIYKETDGYLISNVLNENFNSLHTAAPITPLIGEEIPPEYNVHISQYNFFYDDDSDGSTCALSIESPLLPCVHTETMEEYDGVLFRSVRRKTYRVEDFGATIGSFDLIALRLMFPIVEHDGSDWRFPMYVAVQHKYFEGQPPPPLSIPPLPHIVQGVQLHKPIIMPSPFQSGGKRATKPSSKAPKKKTDVRKPGVVRGRNP